MTQPTVLFVDDEERILRSLAPLFRSAYRVLTTTDAHEALALLRRETVHVLVSDQRMPIMLGAELLRQAREISPATMRLLLTGYSDLEAAIAAVNDGEIFRYINKPWNGQALRDTVAQAAEIALEEFSAPATEVAPAGAMPKVAVLIIDDDAASADTLKDVVRQACGVECEPLWTNNLDEATQLLSSRDIGLVVTEIHVNGEDASATIKALKRYRPDAVTVVVTGYRDNGTLIELINQGQIYRFLPKPVSRGLCGRSIQSALQHHQQLRTRPQLRHRHAVLPSHQERENKLPTRLMGLINRLRNRQEGAPPAA